MQTLRRFVATMVVGALLAVSSVGAAFADPTHGRNTISFNLSCGGEQFTVVSANEPTASVQVVGSTSTLVATNAMLTTTYTDPQTGETVTETQSIVYGAGHGQAAGLAQRLTVCTNTIIVQDPNVGPITVTLIGTFIFTPFT